MYERATVGTHSSSDWERPVWRSGEGGGLRGGGRLGVFGTGGSRSDKPIVGRHFPNSSSLQRPRAKRRSASLWWVTQFSDLRYHLLNLFVIRRHTGDRH